jgi:hypothetical protein
VAEAAEILAQTVQLIQQVMVVLVVAQVECQAVVAVVVLVVQRWNNTVVTLTLDTDQCHFITLLLQQLREQEIKAVEVLAVIKPLAADYFTELQEVQEYTVTVAEAVAEEVATVRVIEEY